MRRFQIGAKFVEARGDVFSFDGEQKLSRDPRIDRTKRAGLKIAGRLNSEDCIWRVGTFMPVYDTEDIGLPEPVI
ncbi:hypothetical protein QMZ05_38165 [Bradyrhizobium sp. INPA03-11B]|uniref:hypothetical protein n=1 Tax=Bradyrhizobium sp. INPA03-11B TaxID=418598 RepID=UPI00338DE3D6